MKDTLKRVREAEEERLYWLEVLELWSLVDATHGKEIRKQVRAFTFRDKFLSIKESRENRGRREGQARKYSSVTHHNCVVLHDDVLLGIPMIERPCKPNHMRGQE